MTKEKTPPNDGTNTSSDAIYGWMVEKLSAGNLTGLCLNIRVGGFHVPIKATLFDSMDAAEAYAAEFGFKIGRDVEVVEHGF